MRGTPFRSPRSSARSACCRAISFPVSAIASALSAWEIHSVVCGSTSFPESLTFFLSIFSILGILQTELYILPLLVNIYKHHITPMYKHVRVLVLHAGFRGLCPACAYVGTLLSSLPQSQVLTHHATQLTTFRIRYSVKL